MSQSIQIYELRCTECMNELDGVPSDKMFVCPSCSVVFCASEGRLKKEALYIARSAQQESGELLFLPFWRYHVTVCVLDTHHRDITDDAMSANTGSVLESVWVPAFFEVRPAVFGNPGLNLSMARIVPEPTLWPADKQMKLPGAARRAEEGAIYAQPYVSGILDRKKDISGYYIDVKIQSSEFWALPFSFNRSEMTLKDLLCGAIYPTSMVERFDDIISF